MKSLGAGASISCWKEEVETDKGILVQPCLNLFLGLTILAQIESNFYQSENKTEMICYLHLM